MKEEPRFKQLDTCVHIMIIKRSQQANSFFLFTTPGATVRSELIRVFYVKRLNINLVKMSKSHLAMI